MAAVQLTAKNFEAAVSVPGVVVVVFALPGARPRRTLEKLLQKVQALDMVKVRQELEAQTPAAQLPAP